MCVVFEQPPKYLAISFTADNECNASDLMLTSYNVDMFEI